MMLLIEVDYIEYFIINMVYIFYIINYIFFN